jgi:protein tyrosine phosphatase (PTP) superfamily phosphohydrolase (DUF442 family)
MVVEISPKEADFWERAAEAREIVKKPDPEQQREGARLNERYWALQTACEDISGEQPIVGEQYREHGVEILAELTEEADAAFRAYCEATGMPLFRA